MADLKYSPEALKDLDDIWEYIHSELSNPDAADHTVNAILDRARRSGSSPTAARRWTPCRASTAITAL